VSFEDSSVIWVELLGGLAQNKISDDSLSVHGVECGEVVVVKEVAILNLLGLRHKQPT